ncbi:MAG: GspH/FimT family pseudopilin [Acidobacteriota bacterium]
MPKSGWAAQGGFNLVEMVVALAVLSFLASISVPPLMRAAAESRIRLAAAEVAHTFHQARAWAVRYGANVGVRFLPGEDFVTWEMFYDGDGDGVRRDDIASGIDPRVLGKRLSRFGPAARFGFPPGAPARDPGRPSRRLDRLDDPIRFNRSDIASFDPLGSATPGSVYLTDGKFRLAAVRVAGASGRIRVLLWDPAKDAWRE